MTVFMRQKVDPFALERGMTILDLQNFLMMWQMKAEQEQKEKEKAQNSGDKLVKSLVAIRDILNYMFPTEK